MFRSPENRIFEEKLFKIKQLTYKIFLAQEPEGGYTVTVPSLPGCITYGETIEQSIEMAKEAIELYIESLKEHGEQIPMCTKFNANKFSGAVKFKEDGLEIQKRLRDEWR